MKILKEWSFDAPWGKIALISWGNQQGKPVLLVHGRQDSASTFEPLLELLPDDYYYVGIDMPGHGKSDPLPIGTAVIRFFGVYVIDITIQHLGWNEFIYLGHSMGSGVGLFYNAIYPGKIKKKIIIDIGPALQHLVVLDFPRFYASYEEYYNDYEKCNTYYRVYTKAEAVQAVMKARDMTKEQAEIILSRNLKKIGEDQYKLSWDRRTKILALMNYPPEYCYELFTRHSPPTLYIVAKHSFRHENTKERGIMNELMLKMSRNVKNFIVLSVDGTHDVHFVHPERISGDICAFFSKDFDETKCKL